MNAVADSSPLVVLAKIGYFELLEFLFPRLYVSPEVHHEVVVLGAGLPGASEVGRADWIEVKSLSSQEDLLRAQQKYALGLGELSTILLGKQLGTAVLLDDSRARKLAKAERLQVFGTVGLLERLYVQGYLDDLRGAFQRLLIHSYIDQGLLNLRLRALGISAL